MVNDPFSNLPFLVVKPNPFDLRSQIRFLILPKKHPRPIFVVVFFTVLVVFTVSLSLHDYMFCLSKLGFNGAETNCGIARILGILLMNSCDT